MLTEQNDILAVLKQFWVSRAGDARLQGAMVVGVSGGADSLALLHGLKESTAVSAQQLTAVYVNHGLRPEAKQEAQFVTNTAQAWGIAVQVRTVDTAVLSGHSLEEAARLLRYRALVACAREVGASTIVVAHTADDQAETVLMHLLRGSGLSGLRGMRPISPLPRSLSDGRGPLWLVRPLLGVWRKEIEAYCSQEGLTPVEDASNRDTAYFRNALRHEVLPYLAQFSPQIKARLNHTAVVVQAEYDVLDDLTQAAWETCVLGAGDGWVRWQRSAWARQPLALQRRLMRRAIAELAGSALRAPRDVGFVTVEQARILLLAGQVGQEAVLPGEIHAQLEYDAILWRSPTAVPPPPSAPQLPDLHDELSLPVPGEVSLATGWRLTAEWVAGHTLPDDLTQTPPWEAYLAVSPTAVLRLRGRRPGERFVPLGMAGHTVKLKEMMINRKIPAALRRRWPLVVDVDDGGVLWLVGLAQAEHTAVRPDTPTVLKLTLHAPAKPSDSGENLL